MSRGAECRELVPAGLPGLVPALLLGLLPALLLGLLPLAGAAQQPDDGDPGPGSNVDIRVERDWVPLPVFRSTIRTEEGVVVSEEVDPELAEELLVDPLEGPRLTLRVAEGWERVRVTSRHRTTEPPVLDTRLSGEEAEELTAYFPTWPGDWWDVCVYSGSPARPPMRIWCHRFGFLFNGAALLWGAFDLTEEARRHHR